MNCSDVHLLLHPFVDGELDLLRSLDIENHLKTCRDCSQKVKSLKSLHSALKEGDLAYPAPASLRSRIRQTIFPEEKIERDFQWLWKWIALGATAVAILAIAIRPLAFSQNNVNDELLDELVASQVRSLQANHLTDVLSSDKHTVKPWFEGKLDFAPAVRDFATNDFSLVGGRLDYVNNRTVAAVVYRHNKHVINVFIWPSENAGNSTEAVSNYHGYNLVAFDLNGLHYDIVSDMEQQEVERLAELLKAGK